MIGVIVNVIIKQDNKILMVQEGWGKVKGMWNFPAGHLDENENIFDGAIREAKEETGYDVKLTNLINIQNCIYNDRHVILVNFSAEIIGGNITYSPDEIMNVEFLDIQKIMDMDDNQLRGGDCRKETIQNLIDDKVYPLEVISNFDLRK